MTVDLDKLMTVAAAAKMTTVSEPTLRARINDGRLKATRLAGAVLIHADALEDYLKRHPEQRVEVALPRSAK
jgi:excisionase family DNA binding protein